MVSPKDHSDTGSQVSLYLAPATQEEVSAYIFSCFPGCLLKASPSKNLALFLQNHEIPADLHDQFDGWNSEAMSAAIKVYIQVGYLFSWLFIYLF